MRRLWLLILLAASPVTFARPALTAVSSFPNLSSSGSTVSVSLPFMISRINTDQPSFMIFYPQDHAQEFRLGVTFEKLSEIAPTNQTPSTQTLRSLDLQTLTWKFSQTVSAQDSRFGRYLRAQLSSITPIKLGANVYHVNVSLLFFASEMQNETTIVANDWAALEPTGGPTQIKIGVSIRGWPFHAVQNTLSLRISLDGSQGTVRHHGEFSATELFNTVGIVNDVTERRDAYIQWLRRAILDNGTARGSADVTLTTFAEGEGTNVDLSYPSFANGTLEHDIDIGTSDNFLPTPFVPLQAANVLFGGAFLLVLTAAIIYFARRSYLTLRRG